MHNLVVLTVEFTDTLSSLLSMIVLFYHSTQVEISRHPSTVLCIPLSQRCRVTSGSWRERQCWSIGLTRMDGGLDQPGVHRDGSQDPMSR